MFAIVPNTLRAYRHVQFPKSDEWFLGAWFELKAGGFERVCPEN